MDIKDINELRSEFEVMQKKMQDDACVVPESINDESKEGYPDYLVALYKEIMPPVKSGIYFSKWDMKGMAAEIDESFSLDVRERMFKKFMQWVATPDDMQLVIEQFKKNIDMKCTLYSEYSQKYPSMKMIFDPKIEKAQNAKKYMDKVYLEFFT
jgi:hypothetical protein